ncbi:MAG TPA: hypothetical protein VF183_07240, partial [Acidimicrobiales bacterium]
GPHDERTLGEWAGKAFAYGDVADDLEYIALKASPREGLAILRGWLDKGNAVILDAHPAHQNWTVVSVGGVTRDGAANPDTWAKPQERMQPIDDHIDDVLDTAIPDRGARVDYCVVSAASLEDAKHRAHRGGMWHRVPDTVLERWLARRES